MFCSGRPPPAHLQNHPIWTSAAHRGITYVRRSHLDSPPARAAGPGPHPSGRRFRAPPLWASPSVFLLGPNLQGEGAGAGAVGSPARKLPNALFNPKRHSQASARKHQDGSQLRFLPDGSARWQTVQSLPVQDWIAVLLRGVPEEALEKWPCVAGGEEYNPSMAGPGLGRSMARALPKSKMLFPAGGSAAPVTCRRCYGRSSRTSQSRCRNSSWSSRNTAGNFKPVQWISKWRSNCRERLF